MKKEKKTNRDFRLHIRLSKEEYYKMEAESERLGIRMGTLGKQWIHTKLFPMKKPVF